MMHLKVNTVYLEVINFSFNRLCFDLQNQIETLRSVLNCTYMTEISSEFQSLERERGDFAKECSLAIAGRHWQIIAIAQGRTDE